MFFILNFCWNYLFVFLFYFVRRINHWKQIVKYSKNKNNNHWNNYYFQFPTKIKNINTQKENSFSLLIFIFTFIILNFKNNEKNLKKQIIHRLFYTLYLLKCNLKKFTFSFILSVSNFLCNSYHSSNSRTLMYSGLRLSISIIFLFFKI